MPDTLVRFLVLGNIGARRATLPAERSTVTKHPNCRALGSAHKANIGIAIFTIMSLVSHLGYVIMNLEHTTLVTYLLEFASNHYFVLN